MKDASLIVDGLVQNPLSLTFSEFTALPGDAQVADVSRLAKGKGGDAVTLESILALACPLAEADHLTLHASRDDFHVSVPLAEIRAVGLLVYRFEGAPLDVKKGGPFRLVLKEYTACHTSQLDDCANVKFLDRIELTRRRGPDTRPTTAEEHAALHAKENH